MQVKFKRTKTSPDNYKYQVKKAVQIPIGRS